MSGNWPGSLARLQEHCTRNSPNWQAQGFCYARSKAIRCAISANRDCPVFAEQAGLFRKTTGIAGVLANALLPLKPQLALIFGSVARGEETASSDVDLLLIGELGFAYVVKALYPAQTALQRKINPVIYTLAELASRLRACDPFVREILAKPKLFITGTEDNLGKLVGDSRAAQLWGQSRNLQPPLCPVSE